MADLTPMKRQYNEIKKKHDNCLLFFRLGDFYEMFDEDARVASRELDIALTTRDRGVENPDDRTPMCGVPYHSVEAYIAKLIAKGYKVAICEQTEDPKLAKGIVQRDVVRIITPGTVTEASMLDERRANYLCSIYMDYSGASICFADITTGEFCVTAFSDDVISHIENELGRFEPKEAVISDGAAENKELMEFLKKRIECMVEHNNDYFDYNAGAERLCKQFEAQTPEELGLGSSPASVCAAGALLGHINNTQKMDLKHINSLDVFSEGRYMELDYVTRRNLELTENLRSGEKKGSLLHVLDKTKTPMGGRMLRSWVERPLLSPIAITRRLSAVEELFKDNVLRSELRVALKDVGDIQRLIGKAVVGTANGRDLVALYCSCSYLPRIAELLAEAKSAELMELSRLDVLEDVCRAISWAICDDPPFSIREGGILREGYSEEVDRLRGIRDNGAQLISELEQRERERTGIKKLKVGYNRVFGYYFDVPRSAGESLPEDFIRKQTLVSNERFFTQELKELESTLLTSREQIAELEYNYFVQIRDSVAGELVRVQRAAEAAARIDVLCSLAEVAVRNGYTKPDIDLSNALDVKEGRHPVVEAVQTNSLFVPNDVFLNSSTDRVAIVTGPNMAGKSTYMRQTALIVLMAQVGSFVPARSAQIGVVDRVFTRIGASDDLAAGQSTFMVEMTEVAMILKHATASSLLILDEIGRGTSTYDGMAIARAVLEYCADKRKLGAKTMFATHYHELSALEGVLPGVRNYNITAKKQKGELIFLRKVVPGAADDSYGIEVAKLAGVPDNVVSKAKEYLKELESSGNAPQISLREDDDDEQISLVDMGADEAARQLRGIDLNTLTPIEAMNLLYELKKKVDG